MGRTPEFVAENEQNISTGKLWEMIFEDSGIPVSMNPSKDDAIYVSQSRTVRELAHHGPCVIIGRLGNWILRDSSDVSATGFSGTILMSSVSSSLPALTRLLSVSLPGSISPGKRLHGKSSGSIPAVPTTTAATPAASGPTSANTTWWSTLTAWASTERSTPFSAPPRTSNSRAAASCPVWLARRLSQTIRPPFWKYKLATDCLLFHKDV